ncbi:MAG TPA: glycosyltransferase family 39 protein [Candidatus Udaeobacter sp.]|jgi:4-amino-4-deoxy-L-arabinose transferase-like glycosyltransferase
MNSRLRAVLVVLFAWAIIYLPALGSIAIKGEEGRRILPAIGMLKTGNYIVPEVGGNPYFRKPPLVNWMVAASFRIFRVRNEWTARLPSAIAVLAVAIAFVTVARASLGPRGSIVAALIWMTNIGMIEKGRLIEIEALYISLCGLAVIFWLSFFVLRKSPWLIWVPSSIFLGLGLLTKGPIHLLFFYAIALAVLWRMKDWRLLIHPAHFVGLMIMLGIFAVWAIPFLHGTTTHIAVAKWSNQFTGRLQGIDFKFASWIQNIPRALIYFLPWVLLFPFVRFLRFHDYAEQRLARALAWGIAVPFVAINLVPGALPRYSMPVIAPASWLLAMSYAGHALAWPWEKGVTDERRWTRIVALFVGVGLVIGGIGYPLAAVVLKDRQQVKKAAAQINALVSANETLYAVDPEYQPVFFYVKAPLEYVSCVQELPADARYFVVRGSKKGALTSVSPGAHLLARVQDYRKSELLLFEVGPK